jgi:hypothetical protein
LSFGILFVPALEEGQTEDDIDVETLEPVMRTTSGDEMIEGDLDVDVGVIFFLWDNDFDWFSNKYLSYTIQVKQVSGGESWGLHVLFSHFCSFSHHSLRLIKSGPLWLKQCSKTC